MQFWPNLGVVVILCCMLGSLPCLVTSFTEDSVSDLKVQLKYLATHLQNCNGKGSDLFDMRLHYIDDRNVTCNYGARAGYYLKKTPGSKRWIVYLEGGMFCYSPESCKHRWDNMRGLMTSSGWPATRRGSGILSPDPEENPHWWNANHVYVPYCSSDVWSGNASKYETGGLSNAAGCKVKTWSGECCVFPFEYLGVKYNSCTTKNNFGQQWCGTTHHYSQDKWGNCADSAEADPETEAISFQGVRILDKVIEKLLPQGLYNANHLLLAGSSAGGIGVILNLDRIADHLRKINSTVKVRGLADSGWYLNGSPLSGCPAGSQNCGPTKTIMEGMKYWKGVVPRECAKANPTTPWNCYFGHNVYPHLKTPLFVFQWLYDEVQLAWGQALKEPTEEELKSILTLSRNITHSLRNSHVHAAFVPACLSHAILSHSDWLKVRIDGCGLDDALQRWFHHHDHQGRCRKSSRASCRCRRQHLIDRCRTPQCNPTCPPRNDNANIQRRRAHSSPGVPIPLHKLRQKMRTP